MVRCSGVGRQLPNDPITSVVPASATVAGDGGGGFGWLGGCGSSHVRRHMWYMT